MKDKTVRVIRRRKTGRGTSDMGKEKKKKKRERNGG